MPDWWEWLLIGYAFIALLYSFQVYPQLRNHDAVDLADDVLFSVFFGFIVGFGWGFVLLWRAFRYMSSFLPDVYQLPRTPLTKD